MKQCLLCKSNQTKVIQTIPTSEIVRLYRDEISLDINSELASYSTIDAVHCLECDLVYFQPMATGSETFYENLQNLEGTYYSDLRPEFLQAFKYIQPNEAVLEVGSGSAYFAERLNNPNYVGLEYNQEAIDKAFQKGIQLIKSSIEDFANQNQEQFDVVCSFHVLEHVVNPYTFIESSIKALKKGGKLIIAVPCNDSLFTSNLNHTLNMPPHHVSRWGVKTMEFICEHFNLSQEHFYNDAVESSKEYFEKKMANFVFGIFSPSKKIIVSPNRLAFFTRYFKKINRLLHLYKLDSSSKKYGKNMVLIATKK